MTEQEQKDYESYSAWIMLYVEVHDIETGEWPGVEATQRAFMNCNPDHPYAFLDNTDL